MKRAHQLLLLAVAGGIGLAAGFVWRTNSSTLSPASLKQPQAANHDSVSPRLRKPIPNDSPLAAQLEHDLSVSSGVAYWLYWMDALEKAAPSDFPRLVSLAKDNPAALHLLARHWIDTCPRTLFDALAEASRSGLVLTACETELAHELFKVWPGRDPQAAIDALNQTSDLGMGLYWRHSVAEAVVETDPERGLRLLTDWHINDFGPDLKSIKRWAAANPQHAAEFTVQNAVGFAAAETMNAIGEQWAKTDPARALDFAVAHPGTLGLELGNAALRQWVRNSPEEAQQWLDDAAATTRSRFSPAFVETWGQTDASAALEWCDENLTGASLVRAVQGVMKGAVDKDIAGAAALVSDMDPSPARTEAALTVARKWMSELNRDSTVKPETVAWLSGLDTDSINAVLNGTVWEWAASDYKSLAAFLAEHPGPIDSYTFKILAAQMARQNPGYALDWVSRLPTSRSQEIGATVFGEWRTWQPQAAMRWFNSLSADDARRQPFFEEAVRLLAYQPQAAEELAAMTGSEQAAARKVIAGISIPEDRRARLLQALAASGQ